MRIIIFKFLNFISSWIVIGLLLLSMVVLLSLEFFSKKSITDQSVFLRKGISLSKKLSDLEGQAGDNISSLDYKKRYEIALERVLEDDDFEYELLKQKIIDDFSKRAWIVDEVKFSNDYDSNILDDLSIISLEVSSRTNLNKSDSDFVYKPTFEALNVIKYLIKEDPLKELVKLKIQRLDQNFKLDCKWLLPLK